MHLFEQVLASLLVAAPGDEATEHDCRAEAYLAVGFEVGLVAEPLGPRTDGLIDRVTQGLPAVFTCGHLPVSIVACSAWR